MRRWRGLKALVQDGVEHGSRAVERVQLGIARRPFELLEKVEPIAVPVRGIREIHDTAVTSVHGMIRLVNRVAGSTLDVVLDVVEKAKPAGAPAPEAKSDPPPAAP